MAEKVPARVLFCWRIPFYGIRKFFLPSSLPVADKEDMPDPERY